MIKANKLIKKLYSYFPYLSQDIWDHSGYQAGVLSSSRKALPGPVVPREYHGRYRRWQL